jgi:hypothetical protein
MESDVPFESKKSVSVRQRSFDERNTKTARTQTRRPNCAGVDAGPAGAELEFEIDDRPSQPLLRTYRPRFNARRVLQMLTRSEGVPTNLEIQSSFTDCCCTNIEFALESEKADECPICLIPNVPGVKPECCKEHQIICLSCLEIYMTQEFQKTHSLVGCTRKEKLQKIFERHYVCPFCRTRTCFLKFMFLLKE